MSAPVVLTAANALVLTSDGDGNLTLAPVRDGNLMLSLSADGYWVKTRLDTHCVQAVRDFLSAWLAANPDDGGRNDP